MNSLSNYINENNILNDVNFVILEALNNNLSNEEIEESFDNIIFESINFNPKNEEELRDLIEIEVGNTSSIDNFNQNWIDYLKKHNINTEKYFPYKLLLDDWSELPNTLKISSENIGLCFRGGKFNISEFDWNKKTREKSIVDIEYDYNKSFFDNLIALFRENKIIWYQFVNFETTVKKNHNKFVFDKSKLKDYKEINIDNLKNKEENKSNDEIQSEKDTKEDTTQAIVNNKDLLTPLAKEAKVTGDQLRDIITKLCVTKSGKARKLEEGVILGLSIMICGALLTVKKNGKKDNAAIKSITEKIVKIMLNKKSIDTIIK